MASLKEVELVSTGVFLPKRVNFERIEEALGPLDNASLQIKKLIGKLRAKMKDVIKTKYSYFALDEKTGQPTESNVSMATKAVKSALDKSSLKAKEIELIVLGLPIPDHLIPCSTPFIQEQLGIPYCSEMEIHSNCTAMTKTLQIAFDALRVGRYKNAIVIYSQNPSAYLTANYYNQEQVVLENILLRWFLSDCASAVVLQAADKVEDGIKLIDVYNDSVGTGTKMGMWLKLGAANFDLNAVIEKGEHHFGQDYRLVNKKAPIMGVESFGKLMRQIGLTANEIDHLIITLPSYTLEATAKDIFKERLSIDPKKWESNVETKGYCGGASLISTLDDLISEKKFVKGQKTACFAVESSKWMNGGFALEYR
ncbi:hypothetical protein A3D23_07200 [candidate division WOR-1 bacterium RIFCSPHIGHO2_02_FULL_53_26]|uniref:Beta-ketoacyl-[acyl-carrier-protein] synthase III N-terminal domain-containing protein n=1 Tax=Candidatus Taylorbacteria bacterium RIFCSPHIGHO2_01_FULL_46_22b TaxID=1802301 RepID=A0A1G2M453_9BACT|nr:MAG: hypothetical protein A3D23_07200 [candidate division WOR-1 bacterium RIFCSPHIGHO2_02_FULL_53_26]OHA18696.1 MAG: hypothetical protein A2664_00160 [Candidatus Taylorbacteria bacterium RIFCSPHIGHO2_01_FULL_46_22b]